MTLTALEELAEMAGLSLFVVALIDHLSGFRFHLAFGESASDSAARR